MASLFPAVFGAPPKSVAALSVGSIARTRQRVVLRQACGVQRDETAIPAHDLCDHGIASAQVLAHAASFLAHEDSLGNGGVMEEPQRLVRMTERDSTDQARDFAGPWPV